MLQNAGPHGVHRSARNASCTRSELTPRRFDPQWELTAGEVHQRYGITTQSWSPPRHGAILSTPTIMAIAARIGPEPDRFGAMRRMHRLLRFAGWRASPAPQPKQPVGSPPID